jgi:hypothetical protein
LNRRSETMSYCDEYDTEDFFATRINAEEWDNATTVNRTKALETATRAIDRLRFKSQKTDSNQANEWPRGGDTEVPNDIKIACCEEALSLLEGRDPIMEEENLRTLSQTYANTKMAYDNKHIAEHIINGLTSPIAWRYLRPYLREINQVTLLRV